MNDCRRTRWAGVLSVALVSLGVFEAFGHEGHDLGITVRVPLIMSPEARSGLELYESKCVSCHGKNAKGTHSGPSLIPYDRAHHPDGEFRSAIRSGVTQHHWNFGDMPSIEGLTEGEISNIITYIRELQAFNANPNHSKN